MRVFAFGAVLAAALAAGAAPFAEPTPEDPRANYSQPIPDTRVAFDMVYVAGGTLRLGSAPDDPHREADEPPARDVTVAPFSGDRKYTSAPSGAAVRGSAAGAFS